MARWFCGQMTWLGEVTARWCYNEEGWVCPSLILCSSGTLSRAQFALCFGSQLSVAGSRAGVTRTPAPLDLFSQTWRQEAGTTAGISLTAASAYPHVAWSSHSMEGEPAVPMCLACTCTYAISFSLKSSLTKSQTCPRYFYYPIWLWK